MTGYELIDEWEHGSGVFVYRVQDGEEDIACGRFAACSGFIEYAGPRDMKLESRWKSLEHAIESMKSLLDDCEVSDQEYGTRLDKVIDYLRAQR